MCGHDILENVVLLQGRRSQGTHSAVFPDVGGEWAQVLRIEADAMSDFAKKEQRHMDAMARQIADILWDNYSAWKNRYVWEDAYRKALALVHEFEGWHPEEPCPDCDEAAKHAYSDATTPGFFSPICSTHQQQRVGETLAEWVKRCGPETVHRILKAQIDKYGARTA
jgi:hypothetical protein